MWLRIREVRDLGSRSVDIFRPIPVTVIALFMMLYMIDYRLNIIVMDSRSETLNPKP